MNTRPLILVASISALITSTATVRATDYFFNVASGDWATAGSWNTGTVPGGGGGNFVYVNNGGTATISSDTNSIQDPFVGRGAGNSGTVNQIAGNHNNVGWTFIGDNGGTGAWNMSGSTNLTTGRLYLGGLRGAGTAGGTGTFTMSSTGVAQFNSDLSVGTHGGSGTLNVNSGTVNAASWFIIGETEGGLGSTGVVNQTGGVVGNATSDANGRLWLGSHENGSTASSSGTYNISGGTLNARNVAIGRHYVGNFNQSGGTVNFTSGEEATNLGQNAGSTGTYNLSAGTLNTNGTFNVGDGGTGVLNVSGSGVANITGSNGLRLGSNGGSGTLNLNGGTTSALFIQKLTGSAQINANGGTVQARAASSDFFVGFTAAQINVQSGGLGFDTNNNAVTITQNLAGAGGLTKVGNGTLTITGAPTYAGITTVTAGTLSAGSGGTTGVVPGTVNVGASGTFAINRSDDLTASNTFTGTGSVSKVGANTLTVSSGFSGFTGTLNVNGGKLINTAAGDLATAGLSINSGARLTPLGGAVGAINTASFTAGTGSTLDFDFSAGGATYDQIVSSGGLNFPGSYTINLFQVGTANAFSDNGTYSLFDYATTVSGSPSGFTVGNPQIGKSYQLANNGGDTTLKMTIADAVLVNWNQSGGGLWSTALNWTPNITPNVATADVNFTGSITGASTVDLDGNKTSGKLTFDNANSYTIGGAGTLTVDNGLAAGSITVTTGNHFINAPLALPNATGVSTATGTTLQVGNVSGAGAITKSGNGTLVLNGATASTGGLVVSGGTVQAGTGGAGNSLPTGNIALSAGTLVSINNTATSTIAGNITGAGSIAQVAAGNVTHTGTGSTYTGSTTLSAGTFTNSGSIVGTSGININNATILSGGSTTTTTGNITVGTGGTLSSAGATSFGSRLIVNDGASAAISAGSVNQTARTDDSGLFVGENGSGTLNVSGGSTSVHDIWVGRNNGAVGNVNITAGVVTATQWTSIGTNVGATGNVTQTGGTLNQNHTDWLSVGENGTGTYTMSGSSVLNDQSVVDTSARGTNKGNIAVARNAGSTGTWTLNDTASARIRDLLVGNGGGSTGTVNINGTAAVVSSYDPHIGIDGSGTVNVNGGSLTTTSGWFQLGINAGSSGTLSMTAGSVYGREFRVGESGTALVDVIGGTLTANQNTTMGINATGNGTLKVRGTGVMSVQNGGMTVGGTGDGALYVGNTAALNINGNLVIGNGGTKIGHGYITGGTTAVNGEMWVGQGAGGSGTLSINAGTIGANNWIVIGRESGLGVVDLSGSGSLVKTGGGHILLGASSSNGTINQTGGSLITAGAGQVLLGENAGGQGTWNMSAGTASVDGIRVGWSGGGSGNFNLGNATVNVGTEGIIIAENGSGTLAQAGGTLTVAGNFDVQSNGTGTYSLTGGRLNANGGLDTGTGSFLFGSGTLSRSSAGVLAISGPITTRGPLSTIKLDNNKTFTISGAFDNNSGLTLDLTGAGIPDGTYLGTPITGSLSLGTIGGLIALQGNAPGDNAFDIGHTSLSGFDDIFDLGFGSLTATRINEDAAFNAATDSVYWIDEDGGNVTVQYNVVPEPSSVALMIGGLLVLARRRRRE